MDERRRELRLTWDEVATRAGIHRETLRQIRNGTGSIRPLSITGLEDALGWPHGHIDAILGGAAAGAPSEPDVTAQTVSWDELLELIEDARATNDRLVYDALMAVKRLRDARTARPLGSPEQGRGQSTG